MLINELKLAKELIRRPSVTPKDAGSINLLAKNLKLLGFKCQMMNFKNLKRLTPHSLNPTFPDPRQK